MPHLAARCTCGRKMRFPRGSTYGAQWTCWKCGTTWTLSTKGIPVHTEGSRPPPTRRAAIPPISRLVKYGIALLLIYLLLRSCG